MKYLYHALIGICMALMVIISFQEGYQKGMLKSYGKGYVNGMFEGYSMCPLPVNK